MQMRLCLLLVLIAAIMVPSAYGDMIQTGTAYSDYKNANWYLDETWDGERIFLQHVDFQQPFTEGQPPIVLVMLNAIDSDKDLNVRIAVSSESVTNYGFNIRYKTWSDTKLYGLGVTWIALPRSMALDVPTKSMPVPTRSMPLERTMSYPYYSYLNPTTGEVIVYSDSASWT